MKCVRVFLGLVLMGSVLTASARTAAPKGTELYFIAPSDGAVVSSPVVVRFGLRGMGVAPAGTQAPNTGHHHLLINTKLVDLTKPIPKDDRHHHFGGGQTESSLKLAPGTYRLQLVLGDHLHVPHDPPVMSAVISIIVK